MRIFVWDNVYGLTTSHHDGGGLVVVAADLDSARALLHDPAHGIPLKCDAHLEAPDFQAELLGDYAPSARVHPDSGCC